MMELLNGRGHALCAADRVVLHAQDPGPTCNLQGNFSGFIGQTQEKLNLLVFSNRQVGIKEDPSNADVARLAVHFQTRLGQLQRDRDLQGKPMGNAPFLAQSSSSSSKSVF